jgi:hypothetical protein
VGKNDERALEWRRGILAPSNAQWRRRDATTVTEQHVVFSTELDETGLILERYALSNAMAASVKLDVWEEMVDDYIDSMSHIPTDLKVRLVRPAKRLTSRLLVFCRGIEWTR